MPAYIRKTAGILLLLTLISCASVPIEQVDGRLAAWKGRTIEELIKYWGLPTNQRQVSDRHYAEWINKSSEPGNTAISIGTGHRGGNSAVGLGLTLFDLGGTDDACSRLVTYNSEGIVTEITWKGTNNFCYEITPELGQVLTNQKQKAQK